MALVEAREQEGAALEFDTYSRSKTSLEKEESDTRHVCLCTFLVFFA